MEPSALGLSLERRGSSLALGHEVGYPISEATLILLSAHALRRKRGKTPPRFSADRREQPIDCSRLCFSGALFRWRVRRMQERAQCGRGVLLHVGQNVRVDLQRHRPFL